MGHPPFAGSGVRGHVRWAPGLGAGRVTCRIDPLPRPCAVGHTHPVDANKLDHPVKHLTLRNGVTVPTLGLGTWRMGESSAARKDEVRALQLGLDLGLMLIDTAEMYGEGGAEEVTGEAMAGRRDAIYLVSKVYPHNASAQGTIAACERSLKRLKTDRLDLYLLHWRGGTPLAETVGAFERLVKDGKIRAWGVSNFDINDMAELRGVAGGQNCLSNQVLYHLGSRGIEWRLLPDAQKSNTMVMAYSPLGQASILKQPALAAVAVKHGVGPAAVAIAWVLRQPGVIAIPKATKPDHVRANAAAATLTLDASDLAALDAAFPPPKRGTPLEVL
jgi:diketogulonate reductase-like aldo/keto reductase